MGAFGPIAAKVIYVDSDGPLLRDYAKLPYTKVQRPIWPLDEVTAPGLIFDRGGQAAPPRPAPSTGTGAYEAGPAGFSQTMK